MLTDIMVAILLLPLWIVIVVLVSIGLICGLVFFAAVGAVGTILIGIIAIIGFVPMKVKGAMNERKS